MADPLSLLVCFAIAGYWLLSTSTFYYLNWQSFKPQIQRDFGYFLLFLILPLFVGWAFLPFVGLYMVWKDFVRKA